MSVPVNVRFCWRYEGPLFFPLRAGLVASTLRGCQSLPASVEVVMSYHRKKFKYASEIVSIYRQNVMHVPEIRHSSYKPTVTYCYCTCTQYGPTPCGNSSGASFWALICLYAAVLCL